MPPISVLAHSIPPFPYDFRARATGRFSRPGAPDLLIDNTPEDFYKGRDAQLEKAVELLKADIAAGKKKGI